MNEGLATEQKTFRLQWRDRAGITPASPIIDGRQSYSAPAVKSIQPVRRSRSLKSSSIASFELTKFAIRAGAEYQNRHSSGTQSLRSDTLNCRDHAFVHVHTDSPPKNKPTRQTAREQASLQIEGSGGYIHVEFAADNLRVSPDPPDDCRSTLPNRMNVATRMFTQTVQRLDGKQTSRWKFRHSSFHSPTRDASNR